MGIEALREAQQPFRLYVRFLKKLLAQSSAVDTLTAQQQRFVRRVIDYYSNAWKYVAMMISEETVHLSPGDNEDALLTSIENDKQEIRSSYEDDLQTFEERAVALDIIPQQTNEPPETTQSQSDVTSNSKGVALLEFSLHNWFSGSTVYTLCTDR